MDRLTRLTPEAGRRPDRGGAHRSLDVVGSGHGRRTRLRALEPAGDHLSLPRGFRYEVLDQTGDPNPRTGIVYMTEDDTPAGFYRFVPRDSNDLTVGCTLQILAVQGQPGYDTRKHQTAGRDLGTTWVTIADPDPDVDGGGPTARVLSQGVAAGGAVFDYLEGEDFRNGAVTFASAYGGDNNHGQVWRYTPATGRLRLLSETANRAVLDAPDNVAVSPRGGVLLCEDGYPRNFLRGLTASGQIFDFAENLVAGDFAFSGPAYTPDGQWLAVGIQRPGITVAITGPWGSGLL